MQHMSDTQLIQTIGKILSDQFFLSDMIWQEDLFKMQDQLAELITSQANAGSRLAMRFADTCPKTFTTTEI